MAEALADLIGSGESLILERMRGRFTKEHIMRIEKSLWLISIFSYLSSPRKRP